MSASRRGSRWVEVAVEVAAALALAALYVLVVTRGDIGGWP